MNHAPASAHVAERFETRNESETRLQGYWLVLARLVCGTLCVVSVALYVASVLSYIANHYCMVATAACHAYGPIIVQTMHGSGLSRDFFGIYTIVRDSIFSLVYWLVAAFLLWRRSDDRIALLAALSMGIFPVVFNNGFTSTLPMPWLFLAQILSFLGFSCIGLFFYVFPSGHFVPGWMRWVFVALFLYGAFNALFPAASFVLLSTHPELIGTIFIGQIVSIVVVQIYRYRRVSSPAQRQQTKWVVYGVSIGFGGYLALLMLSLFFPALYQANPLINVIAGIALYSFILLIPFFIGIAVVRSRLWDIDVIINRTLVYGFLTICVVGGYVLVVGYLGALFGTSGNLLISLIATGLVAVLFQPARAWVQRSVNHLLYGQRDEPYAVITNLSQRVEATLAPDAVLSTIVETVAQTLKLPYVAILLRQDNAFQLAASTGELTGELLALPLVYQKDTIGQLHLAPRSPGEPFSAADRRLLDELARQTGLAAHAVQLTADLQRSYEHLEHAALEERQKLARELHDSVSQALYSIALGLHTAHIQLERDQEKLPATLTDLLALAEAALAEMRALIFELRPESLEREGLVVALSKQTAAIHARYDLLVQTELCEEPPLALKVKQELYRIAQEALHNTVKHAHANKIHLLLSQTANQVILEVNDDGVGFEVADSFPGHLGLRSMQERVSHLGGELEIESAPGQGTHLHVVVPL